MPARAEPKATSAEAPPVAPPAAPRVDPRIGSSLGRLELQTVLGRGGMGVVYEAHDPVLGRKVAIKLLSDLKASDPEAQARFLREARAVGRLNHPNVVTIHEINDTEPDRYLVLEYVDGGSLADAMRAGPLPWRDATKYVEQACRGLAVAHRANLVHRDLKPANLLITKTGSVKVTDFGLAKEIGLKDADLTQDNKTLGTPSYMSPEQCHAQKLDARSDIYSLGATYFALLTGVGPFDDQGSATGVMMGHCFKPAPDPRTRNPEVPAGVARVVMKAMAKSPADRYQTVKELRSALQALLASDGRKRSRGRGERLGDEAASDDLGGSPWWRVPLATTRRRWMTGALAGGVLAGGAGIAWFRRRPPRATTPGLDGPDTSPEAIAAPRPASSAQPIKIGLLASESGTLAITEISTIQGVDLAVGVLNRAGGVLGRPLKLVHRDGRSRPEVFAREAERLISAEAVAALFGCWTSACRKAVKPVVEQHATLLFYPTPFEGLELSPWIVYLGATSNQHVLPALAWCQEQGKRRFYLVGSDYIYPRASAAVVRDELARTGGEVVGESFVSLGQGEMSDTVAEIERQQPDMILNFINGDSNISFFRGLRRAGITPRTIPTLSFCLSGGSIRMLDSATLVGDYVAGNYFEDLRQSENAPFLADFHARFGLARFASDGVESAYASVMLWAAAVEAASSIEGPQVRKALAGLSFTAPEGPIRVDPDTRYCARFCRLARIEPGNRFHVVWNSNLPVEPVPFPPTRTPWEWEQYLDGLKRGWNGQWQADIEPART